MDLLVNLSLLLDILLDHGFVAILAYRVEIEAAGPELASPEEFLDFAVVSKDLSGGDALDRAHHLGGEDIRDALDQEVGMVVIQANLDKMDFVPLGDAQTGGFQSFGD